LASRNRMWWRRASGCSNRGIKLSMKSHISLSVNLYWIKTWSDLDIQCRKLIIWCEVLQVTTSRESMPKQDQMWQPSQSQREMKWQESTLYKLKLKKCILCFILSMNAALSRGISHGLPTKSQCSHSLKTQVRWVKHNGLIHFTSHQILKKPYVPIFKTECPI
jgi:hypothetical protein